MSSQDHHVGLVVDRTFGERISELADSFHVWVVQSPINTPVIERFWKRLGIGRDVDALSAGITSFEAMDDESANATSTRIASDIDEHHGEFAHDPPWSEIHVYGTPLSHELEQVFRELGATEFEPTKDGFISRR